MVYFLGGFLIAGISAGSMCFGMISFGGPGSRSVGSSIKAGASIVGGLVSSDLLDSEGDCGMHFFRMARRRLRKRLFPIALCPV